MKETNTHLEDLKTVLRIAERINKFDTEYINRLMKEAAVVQNFFSSSVVQLTGELDPEASEDLLALYLTVWGSFRQYPGCRNTKITQKHFERLQQRNISMFDYLEGEDDNNLFGEVVHDDHNRLNNSALMQYVSHCFQSLPSLKKMEMNDYCVQLIGIKSFIECFEEIAGE